MNSDYRGVLIAGMGLPGCGKSSLFGHLEKIVKDVSCLREPEEKEWSDAVHRRDEVGHITCLHWFRSTRVPHLYSARHSADNGRIVLLDSFYDKLCHYYLGKPGLEWLLKPEDPYFENFLETANLDLLHLPDADVLVAIEVNEADWLMMIAGRNRSLDDKTNLHKTYHTQALFLDAAGQYCRERNVKLVRFKNLFSTVEESAHRLQEVLKKAGVLS